MNILKHNPVSSLSAFKDGFFGRFFLTLSHGNIDKSSVVSSNIKFGSYFFYFGGGIYSWEKHKEHGYIFGTFLEGFENIERTLFYIFLSHFFSNKIRECRSYSIGSHGSQKHQSVEFGDFFEGFRQISNFGFFILVPFFPL